MAVYAYTYPPIVDPDPSSCFDMTIATLLNVYDTLLRYDPDTDTVQYQLCDSYEFSEAATSGRGPNSTTARRSMRRRSNTPLSVP